MNIDLNEKVLEAWLNVSSAINNQRLVEKMTFSEALVCHYIYLGEEDITASLLCKKTGILKSQMNRILNSLETNGLINKKRSQKDKRDILILPSDNKEIFLNQHKQILEIVQKITSRLGEKVSLDLIDIFNKVANIAKEEL